MSRETWFVNMSGTSTKARSENMFGGGPSGGGYSGSGNSAIKFSKLFGVLVLGRYGLEGRGLTFQKKGSVFQSDYYFT